MTETAFWIAPAGAALGLLWAGLLWRDILRQDQVDSFESDHLGEAWAIELPPLPVDGGAISGRVEDLQGDLTQRVALAV